jgi:hypothetical protein
MGSVEVDIVGVQYRFLDLGNSRIRHPMLIRSILHLHSAVRSWCLIPQAYGTHVISMTDSDSQSGALVPDHAPAPRSSRPALRSPFALWANQTGIRQERFPTPSDPFPVGR